ncbi:MAG: [NiFe]-hydrogenase assembly chaperone HybE [Candidatus Competibacteraceae bacterium]|nr:[NiFe]-hydrogenase assembly chaperone HybE [Candidatus Competibacteraceae bacterium]
MTAIESRIEELVAHFRQIGVIQIRDLPIYNAGLEVEAVGFQAVGNRWIGVLITPWFMNAILLPSEKTALDAKLIGQKSQEALPAATCAFISGGDETVGGYKSLSLYSPMAAFTSQDRARHEAQARLTALLTPPAELPKPVAQESPPQEPANLSRRAFLRGRRNA